MKGFMQRFLICTMIALSLAVVAIPAYAGLIGGNFFISGSGCRFPDAAYNSVDAKYLVVWVDYNYSPARVFGRFASNAGVALGSPFQISDGSTYSLYPAVAYNATNNEFLVTFDDGRGDTITGQRVRGSDGALLGGNFTIGSVYGGGRSSVAWSSTSNCYLVVYAVGDAYARRVSNTGALLGSEMNLSSDPDYSGYPSVAYSASGNQFLATWDYSPNENGYGYIDGRRIDAATGNFLGGRIPVARSIACDRSQATYDSVNNRWMVQYQNQGNPGYSYDQYGQLINIDGTLYGEPIALAHTTGFEGETLLGCDVAFVPTANRFFSVFQTDIGMGGQESHPSGALTGSQITLSSGYGGSMSNAGDTSLSRFLTVFESYESSSYYIRAQLYEATADPAPGPVIGLVAASDDQAITLYWTNPIESDFTGTMIRYKTTGYPTSPSDGNLVVDKSGTPGVGDAYYHGSLNNGTTYYYTVYAHDGTGHYALPCYATAVPTAPLCLSEPFTYSNGNLNGNGGWSGSATSQIVVENQTVKINGGATAYDAIRTTSCGDPGTGYITVTVKIKSGTGTTNMWDLWIDDASGLNLARWYGSGTTARGRIAATASVTATQTLTGGWDELKVVINPYNNTSLFYFNGASLGSLDHSVTGAGDSIGRLRFSRTDNSAAAGNYIYFDDLVIGEPGDTTPPVPVTNFTITAGNGQNNLSWTNPSTSDFTGTMIRYRTDTYPTSATDGTLVVNKTNTPGSADNYPHTGLTNGTTYYYAAFAHDAVPNYATSATGSGIPTGPSNNAQYISDTIPTVMIAGQQYSVSVTMKNTGGSTWTNAAQYKLGAVGDTDPFAGTRQYLDTGDSIAPNAQKTFTFTMTAPSTPATYTTDWRMVQDGVEWFGDTLTKQVQVMNLPAAPSVSSPANGAVLTTLTPSISWSGDAHDQYQVRVSQQNDANTSTNGWDSGQVVSSGSSATCGTLRDYSYYYVFVRLHNAAGWGNWSVAGRYFVTSTSTVNGTVYLGDALPTTCLWQVYDTGSFENGSGITSTIVADGGSNVWKCYDNSSSNRCKEKYTNGLNISFDTGASVASRMKATSVSGTPTYCLGISNGNVGGMYLRLYTNEVRFVDINGTNRGSYSLDATQYHKYQLTVKNSTAGNNSTAVWRVYVDGIQRITWIGAGTDNGFDGFYAGQAGTAAKGYWWFDWIAGRADGEFSPTQWDPLY